MRRRLSTAGVVVVLSVSVALLPSASSGPARATSGPGCDPALPVVAHRAGGQVVTLPAASALPVACAVETGYASSESTIAVSGSGALIYSPALTENSMARSADAGASWQLTYP